MWSRTPIFDGSLMSEKMLCSIPSSRLSRDYLDHCACGPCTAFLILIQPHVPKWVEEELGNPYFDMILVILFFLLLAYKRILWL